MDKQMTFDEWHQNTDSLCPRRAFEAGQQSRQAEIDEKDKRIETALDLMIDGHYELAEQALRGEHE
ncbi:hypothetical protein [Acinetobacter sp. CFCC 10889]|uniref:hypothetical protein n=1 Tax=Acinetobacter sp. CFCC 10889 TaxID=1775557 RepID=UPI000DCFF653|nr:hypothetical protein [Acinetobacter sp. CFCC 10889]